MEKETPRSHLRESASRLAFGQLFCFEQPLVDALDMPSASLCLKLTRSPSQAVRRYVLELSHRPRLNVFASYEAQRTMGLIRQTQLEPKSSRRPTSHMQQQT